MAIPPYYIQLRLAAKDERFIDQMISQFEPALYTEMHQELRRAAEAAQAAARSEFYGGVDPVTMWPRVRDSASETWDAIQIEEQEEKMLRYITGQPTGVINIAVKLDPAVPQAWVLEDDTPGAWYMASGRFVDWALRKVPTVTDEKQALWFVRGVVKARRGIGWHGRHHMEAARETGRVKMQDSKQRLADRAMLRFRTRNMGYRRDLVPAMAAQRASDLQDVLSRGLRQRADTSWL